MTKKYSIVHCQEMEVMAQDLLKNYPERFNQIVTVNWGQFPDKTPNLNINGVERLEGKHVLFLGSFKGYKNKYTQLSICYVLTRSFIKSLTILYPFIDTGTMERVDSEGQVATADIDSWMLSSLPYTSGPAKVIVYDLHTLQNRFYFHDGALIKMASAIPVFKNKIKDMNSKDEKVAIAFPDDGAAKRFGKSFQDYPVIVCGKVRDGDERVVTIKDGDPSGCTVFIVDDLVQSGGTLIQCKNALETKGANKVGAFVTHVIFPKDSWKRFLPGAQGDGFCKFYATDTCPDVATEIDGVGPFEILTIRDSIMEYI